MLATTLPKKFNGDTHVYLRCLFLSNDFIAVSFSNSLFLSLLLLSKPVFAVRFVRINVFIYAITYQPNIFLELFIVGLVPLGVYTGTFLCFSPILEDANACASNRNNGEVNFVYQYVSFGIEMYFRLQTAVRQSFSPTRNTWPKIRKFMCVSLSDPQIKTMLTGNSREA